MNIQFPQLVLNYAELLPYFVSALVVTLLVTPLVGKLAYKIGALDIPASLAGRGERNLEKRISSKITARLGGLGMVIGILSVLALSPEVNFSQWGVVLGLIILTVVGILDDTVDLPPAYQFVAQFAAAACVVFGGSTFNTISIAGEFNQILNLGSTDINILGFIHTFIFPADLVAIFWIVAMINFVNWVGGVDGLNGGVSAIAAAAFLLIAMQIGKPELAALIAVHLGAILGVLPFNYYPSKIFYGFGESINGYLLAVFAISGEIKFAGSVIILGLPLLDALWVAWTRIHHRSKETKNIFQLVAATLRSDRNHLHHRLLDLGYSWKSVLFIEMGIMSGFALFAFYISGFSISALQFMLALVAMMLILGGISFARYRAKRLQSEIEAREAARPKIEVKVANQEDKSLEDRYAY